MSALDPKVSAAIEAIDLTQAKERLQDPKKGWKWSADKVKKIEEKYKNFLRLIATGMTAVPTLDVDELWHLHILDTKAYAADCKRCFGKFIHHMPYMGTGDLNNSWEQTNSAYKELFGEDYSPKK
jgi:hypothetical protein